MSYLHILFPIGAEFGPVLGYLLEGVTITYMMNKMSNAGLGSGNAKEYIWEIYRALGVAIPGEEQATKA